MVRGAESWPNAVLRHRTIACIGDIVASRQLRPDVRRKVQRTLTEKLKEMNLLLGPGLVADFAVTLGDEFEGVIGVAFASHAIPDLIWAMEDALSAVTMRFGVGLGSIDTELSRDPRMMDGSAFHNARSAIEVASKGKRLGGVFQGFGETHDAVLNGLARVLYLQRSRWSPRQRQLMNLLRGGKRQNEAAEILGLTKQAVSAYARAAGWQTYGEGETAWRIAIATALSVAR
jgi:hypothetical protein